MTFIRSIIAEFFWFLACLCGAIAMGFGEAGDYISPTDKETPK